jgi:arsenite methyltransferase
MSQLVFDEDASAQLEAIYQIRDARRRRRLVRDALRASPGERVLDVGCGPGFYCVEIADEVGTSGSVVGLDTSPAMLALARRRCAAHANVDLREGDAGALPVEAGAFDAAVCVQVLEYVDDATAALVEIGRALRPGGRVVVWDIDWATLSIHAEDDARAARVLRAWDQHLAHRSLPRTLAPRLRSAGFEDVAMQGHAFTAIAFDAQTYAVGALGTIESYVAGREGLTDEDVQAWMTELRALGDRGAFYFAVTQFCFTAAKPV